MNATQLTALLKLVEIHEVSVPEALSIIMKENLSQKGKSWKEGFQDAERVYKILE